MNELFVSGHAIDLVITVLVIEVLVVRVWLGRHGALPAPTLLAGLGLLLAWRFAQAGWAWGYVASALTFAGAAHGWDLWRQWRVR
jgi:uncharacterized membrane protein AbrB (regulator of aidB expression)